MVERDTPPVEPDAMVWWEHREVGETHSESAADLAQRARAEPGDAATLLAQAQVQALLAVYHQTRAAGEHQELLLRRLQALTEELESHTAALDRQADSFADYAESHAAALDRHARGFAEHASTFSRHSRVMGEHSQRMGELARAISGHGDDIRHALRGLER